MHTAWLILKILLIAFGILLGLVLLLLLLFLFVPFVYRVDAQFSEGCEINARVSWMSFFLDLRAQYRQTAAAEPAEEKQNSFYYYLRSFWVLLATNDERKLSSVTKRKKKKKEDSSDDGSNERKSDEGEIPTIEAADVDSVWDTDLEPWEEGKEQSGEAPFWRYIRSFFHALELIFTAPARLVLMVYRIWRKIADIIAHGHRAAEGLLDKLRLVNRKREQLLRLYELPTTKTAISNSKGYILDLLSHLKPKKLEGDITLGMDNPAVTGQIFGVLGLLLPIYYDNIKLTAYFEGQMLKGDIHMRGGITIAYLLWLLLKIYRDKYTMKTYERIKKISGGKNNGK